MLTYYAGLLTYYYGRLDVLFLANNSIRYNNGTKNFV